MVAAGAWLEVWSDEWLPAWNQLGCGDFSNKYPTLATAILRLTLGLLAAEYFDEVFLMDVATISQHAKLMLQQNFQPLVLSPKNLNPFPMQGTLQNERAVFIIPREVSLQQVIVDLSRALGAGIMSEAQAAKTRGRSNWVGPTASDALAAGGWPSTSTCRTKDLAACRTFSGTHCDFSSKNHSKHAAMENQSGPWPRNSTCHPLRC